MDQKRRILAFGLFAFGIFEFLSLFKLQLAEAKVVIATSFRDCFYCPEMVIVPKGTLLLGTTETLQVPTEVPAELTPIPIRIDNSFALGRYEVTREEYATFAMATNRDKSTIRCRTWVESRQGFRDISTTWDHPNIPANPSLRHPASCIDWWDALAYTKWLSALTGANYRLPSEVEWEYAAKAGGASLLPWGNNSAQGCHQANSNDRSTSRAYPLAWASIDCDDGFKDIAPVGSLKPNAFGLYDMIGNVWEWTEDCSTLSYVGRPTDARPWVWEGGCKRRIQRGGGWSTGPERSRPSFHGDGNDDDRADFAGFRIARDLQPTLDTAINPTTQRILTSPNSEPLYKTQDCKDCPEVIKITAGSFLMGSSADEYEHDLSTGETPPLAVKIRENFALGRFEVTRAQFTLFVNSTRYKPNFACALKGDAPPATPIRCIHPIDAKAYVQWLSQRSGRNYRLPSESEWEYATRAGSTGARFWSARDSHEGVSISHACDFANVYDVSARSEKIIDQYARCNDGYPKMAPVGSFQPNPWGFYDLIGNVRELVADCHTASYKGRPADERPWHWSGCTRIVLRGGSWKSRPLSARSAAREGISLDEIEDNWRDIGFRVARD